MALRLEDKWIWDLWIAVEGADYHVYYLQAPRSLSDPELRHRNVTIGHAVSQDLRSWEILPDALQPAREQGAWDDFTTWTGSVLQYEGLWYMFYTGGKRAENALIQRIGFAVSKDLIYWERFPDNPVIQHDPQRYEPFDPEVWHDHTWRDPWVVKDPGSDSFYAFITARVNHGPQDGRGVIALARSIDMKTWEILDHVTETGNFGYMEVPQVVRANEKYYLLFSTVKDFHSQERRRTTRQTPVTGLHYLVAEKLTGPYRFTTDAFLLGDPVGAYYAAKILKDSYDDWVLLPMRYLDEQGRFVGEMHDPIPLHFRNDGTMALEGGDTIR